jgi:prepilin-type N-terminal cleavage/methylation domain-containing protein
MNGYLYILNIFRKSKSSAGFTLIELLVAMMLTTIVVSIAGFGLVTIAAANNKAQAETERRVNLNRALDFIADEIRMSNSVNTGSSLTISGATGVLHLTIPSDSTNPNRVYYIGPSDSNWVGPNTVFRAVGTYTTTATVSGGSMLVDAITAPVSAPSCSGTLAGANGFYACVQNNRMVDLYLYGKLTDAYNNQTGTYEVKTRVFARSR